MLKWTALLISLVGVILYDFAQQRKCAEVRALIKTREAELRPLAAYDREVEQYRVEKDELQRRIDVINHLKQNQITASQVVATIASVEDARLIDSVSVTGPQTLVINGHASSDSEIDDLAQRLGAIEKRVAADRTFVLRVSR